MKATEGFTKEYETTMAIVANAIFDCDITYDADVDWNAVLDELKYQQIVGLATDEIDRIKLDEDVRIKFNKCISGREAIYTRICVATRKLVKILNDNNIRFVIIKGLAAAKYYPHPERRGMGDIDLLVAPEDFDRADQVLRENGFEFGERSYRHNTYEYGTVDFELHRQFTKYTNENELSYIDQTLIDAIPRATIESNALVQFPVLPDAENGLVLLRHIQNHISEGIGLRHIVDWMTFVDRVLDDDFWDSQFKNIAEQAGLVQLAKVATRMCQKYLGLSEANVQWCKDVDDSKCYTLADYVYRNGNFGNKAPSTLSTSLAEVSEQGGFFKSLQHKGLQSGWKAMEKYPFLKNFAWLYKIYKCLKIRVDNGTVLEFLVNGRKKHSNYQQLKKDLGL